MLLLVSTGVGSGDGVGIFSSPGVGSATSPMLRSPMIYRRTSLNVMMPNSLPFLPPRRSSSYETESENLEEQHRSIRTSPSTTTSLCTRRFLMSCIRVPRESDAVHMTTPGKSGER